MSVGDVTSSARGSGARFNDGKPPLELIPLKVMAEALWREDFYEGQRQAHAALTALGKWQATGLVGWLYEALNALDYPWEDIARVLDYGRRKYASWNWAKGMAWSIPTGCAARHLQAAITGERCDVESGLPHSGHAGCNLVFLITYHDTFPEGDDRPRALAPARAQSENDRSHNENIALLSALPPPGPFIADVSSEIQESRIPPVTELDE